MKLLLIAVAAASMAGCVAPPSWDEGPAMLTRVIVASFDAEKARTATRNDGSNTIKANAFMRQQGGGIVTCAGGRVLLVPVTAYAEERFGHIYGGRGYTEGRPFTFVPDPPEYRLLVRESVCDSQGVAEFSKVPDGDFFVTAVVQWIVARQPQGGHLMKRVTVKGGEAVSVVLTR